MKGKPKGPFYPSLLAMLFNQLYERTGDQNALEQAIEYYNQALALTPEDHPDRLELFEDLKAAYRALRAHRSSKKQSVQRKSKYKQGVEGESRGKGDE